MRCSSLCRSCLKVEKTVSRLSDQEAVPDWLDFHLSSLKIRSADKQKTPIKQNHCMCMRAPFSFLMMIEAFHEKSSKTF